MTTRSFLRKLKPIAFGISMADMALLLLVFFMASTSTEPPRGVVVELPRATTQAAEQESLYVTVSQTGEIYLDGKKTGIQDLKDSLAMRQSEKDKIVSITADKNLEYRVIQSVLSALREQDFLNVVFMSESRDAGGGLP